VVQNHKHRLWKMASCKAIILRTLCGRIVMANAAKEWHQAKTEHIGACQSCLCVSLCLV